MTGQIKIYKSAGGIFCFCHMAKWVRALTENQLISSVIPFGIILVCWVNPDVEFGYKLISSKQNPCREIK